MKQQDYRNKKRNHGECVHRDYPSNRALYAYERFFHVPVHETCGILGKIKECVFLLMLDEKPYYAYIIADCTFYR